MNIQEPHDAEAIPAADPSVSSSSLGPIPSPEVLREYETFYPGFAAKVLDLVQGQAEHRRRLEEQRVQLEGERLAANLRLATTGALLAILLGASFVVYGFYALGHNNREQLNLYMCVLAGLFGGIASFATTWLVRTSAKSQEGLTAIGREQAVRDLASRREQVHG